MKSLLEPISSCALLNTHLRDADSADDRLRVRDLFLKHFQGNVAAAAAAWSRLNDCGRKRKEFGNGMG